MAKTLDAETQFWNCLDDYLIVKCQYKDFWNQWTSYKSFTITIYDCIDSGQYYKSTITIIIYDYSLI